MLLVVVRKRFEAQCPVRVTLIYEKLGKFDVQPSVNNCLSRYFLIIAKCVEADLPENTIFPNAD